MGSSGSGRRSSFSPVLGGDQESTVFIVVLEVAIPCSTVPPLDCYSVSRDASFSRSFENLSFYRKATKLMHVFLVLPCFYIRSSSLFLAVFPTPFASTFRPRPPLPRNPTTTSLLHLVSSLRRKFRRRNSLSKGRFKARRRWRSDGQRQPRRASSTRRPLRRQEEDRRWSPFESRTPRSLTPSWNHLRKQERPWRSSWSTSARRQSISRESNRPSSSTSNSICQPPNLSNGSNFHMLRHTLRPTLDSPPSNSWNPLLNKTTRTRRRLRPFNHLPRPLLPIDLLPTSPTYPNPT